MTLTIALVLRRGAARAGGGRRGHRARSPPPRGSSTARASSLPAVSFVAAAGASPRRGGAVRASRCRSACRGSARISASTRCPPSSSSWSISAPLSASLFALGYGEHETAPQRVLPFYPAFLAGMTLVVLADDAFTFLFSWEFMSLTSWALVMSHHRVAGKRARRLRLSGDGELRHARAAARLRPAGRPGRRLRLRRRCAPRIRRPAIGALVADPGADRRRLEGRHRAAACLAAARPSGGAEPRLRADERRDDQGRRLRLRAHRLRARRPAGLVVEHRRARASAASPR